MASNTKALDRRLFGHDGARDRGPLGRCSRAFQIQLGRRMPRNQYVVIGLAQGIAPLAYRRALREWPIAVAGKGGSYQLDPAFPGPE